MRVRVTLCIFALYASSILVLASPLVRKDIIDLDHNGTPDWCVDNGDGSASCLENNTWTRVVTRTSSTKAQTSTMLPRITTTSSARSTSSSSRLVATSISKTTSSSRVTSNTSKASSVVASSATGTKKSTTTTTAATTSRPITSITTLRSVTSTTTSSKSTSKSTSGTSSTTKSASVITTLTSTLTRTTPSSSVSIQTVSTSSNGSKSLMVTATSQTMLPVSTLRSTSTVSLSTLSSTTTKNATTVISFTQSPSTTSIPTSTSTLGVTTTLPQTSTISTSATTGSSSTAAASASSSSSQSTLVATSTSSTTATSPLSTASSDTATMVTSIALATPPVNTSTTSPATTTTGTSTGLPTITTSAFTSNSTSTLLITSTSTTTFISLNGTSTSVPIVQTTAFSTLSSITAKSSTTPVFNSSSTSSPIWNNNTTSTSLDSSVIVTTSLSLNVSVTSTFATTGLYTSYPIGSNTTSATVSFISTSTTSITATSNANATSVLSSPIATATNVTNNTSIASGVLPAPSVFKVDKGTKWNVTMVGNITYTGPLANQNVNGDKCRTGMVGGRIMWNCGDMQCGESWTNCGFTLGAAFYGTNSVMTINTDNVTNLGSNNFVMPWSGDPTPQSGGFTDWGMDTSNVVPLDDTRSVVYAWEIWRSVDGTYQDRGTAVSIVTAGPTKPIATRMGPLLTGPDSVQLGLLATLRDGDYVYIYSYSQSSPSRLLVTRVPATVQAVLDATQYDSLVYSGNPDPATGASNSSSTWAKGVIPKSSDTTYGMSTSNGIFGCAVYGSVFFNSYLQKYVIICNIFMWWTNMYVSDTPWGPWSEEYSILPGVIMGYGSMAHPEYGNGRDVYFSQGPGGVFNMFKVSLGY